MCKITGRIFFIYFLHALNVSANVVYLNGCGDSIVRDVFKNFLDAYAVERLQEVLGEFYELSMEKSLQQLECPDSSSILYAAYGNLDANDSSLNSQDLTEFPLFYVPYVAVANVPSDDVKVGKIGLIQLTPQILRDIFHGAITLWNDPLIQGLNSDIKLPEKSIIPISSGGGNSSLSSSNNQFCFRQATSDKVTCLQPQSSDTAALCYAIPYSIGFSTSIQAKIYDITSIELTNGQTTLSPLLSSVETFIYDPTNPISYPLVKPISLILKNKYTNGGKLNPNICKAAAELKRFLEWLVTSEIARDILNNASCVLIGDKYEVLKSYLTGMKCNHDDDLMTIELYEQEVVAEKDDDDGADLDNLIIFTVTGNCFGILLLVIGVMVMRRFLNQWAEIRDDVWKITELDLIPPESERLESFSTLMPQTSPRHSFTQFERIASCQGSSLIVPGFSALDSKSICGIYKSTSITLNPTQIPLLRTFDYNTRKTLVEIRKVSHSSVLRFYGLANILDRKDIQLSEDDETRDLRFAAGDNFSEKHSFSFENNNKNNYYVVTEQCTGESIFYFMHCSSMTFPSEAKIPVIIQLIDAIDYLHNHGIVHGKLNSQCCYFDHNFNIKVGDWECLETLEKYGRLHNSDIYLPSKMIAFLQEINALRPASDRKCRTMDCVNMNGVMRLRWRPPECLWFELPLVKELFSSPEELARAIDEQVEGIEELEDPPNKSYKIPLSHFQDPAVDIYSLGVIINEIWARAIPFSEKDPEYEGEIQLLEAVVQGDISLEIPTNIPEVFKNVITDCTDTVSINRPNISTVKKMAADLSHISKTGLEIYLDIIDRKMKDAEHKVASLDEEEKRINAVREAIIREFLPKPLADKTLAAISEGSAEMAALESCMKPNRYLQVTACALRLVNFYESTQNLPPEEIVAALNRLNRLVTNIIEERKILRISSFGTIVMMISDPESEDNDSVKQAISMANCALDLQNCLRCFGKVPRTDVNPEFAIALETGAVAIGVMPGNVPSLCVFGRVMQNARDILKFAAPKYVCLSKTTKDLLSGEDQFEMVGICTDTEFGEIYRLQKKK